MEVARRNYLAEDYTSYSVKEDYGTGIIAFYIDEHVKKTPS